MKLRHVPPAALRAIALTVGRVRPELGRQARAALAMDSENMTFDDPIARSRFSDLPRTTPAEVLA